MSIDHDSPDLLHVQLAEILRGQIASGELAPRRKVMPQLEMVSHYGVSRGTVSRALDMLAADGLIRWVKGRGYFTADPEVIAAWKKQRGRKS